MHWMKLDAFEFSSAYRDVLERGGVETGQLPWPGFRAGFRLTEEELELTYPLPSTGKDYMLPLVVERCRGRFYLLCPCCSRRVRFLYLDRWSQDFRCRTCQRIPYERDRSRSKLALAFEALERTVRGGGPLPWDQAEYLDKYLGLEIPRPGLRPGLRVERSPGRPREKRDYRADGSRRVKLAEGEAYCCRCRSPRRSRGARRVVLRPLGGKRLALRGRCVECARPVFRIVGLPSG